jgi:aminoglycoside phosphotransferase (APT) family kinase protein
LADKPPAEVEVTEGLVRALLESQHPDLSRLALAEVPGGWDNSMWRLGDDLALRLPRREMAAPLILNEQRWLPELATRLPVPVPAPVRVGVPEQGYPWHWSVVPWLSGARALDVPVAARAKLIPGLADFLEALHVAAPPEAPANPFRGVPLAERDAPVRQRLAGMSPHLLDIWEMAVSAPVWEGPQVWLHGDLHPGNILVDEEGALSGVVDFGDLTSGDPATDLAVGWFGFDRSGRAGLREALGSAVDDATWDRARGWAVAMGSAIAAASDDELAYAAMGANALTQALSDS